MALMGNNGRYWNVLLCWFVQCQGVGADFVIVSFLLRVLRVPCGYVGVRFWGFEVLEAYDVVWI